MKHRISILNIVQVIFLSISLMIIVIMLDVLTRKHPSVEMGMGYWIAIYIIAITILLYKAISNPSSLRWLNRIIAAIILVSSIIIIPFNIQQLQQASFVFSTGLNFSLLSLYHIIVSPLIFSLLHILALAAGIGSIILLYKHDKAWQQALSEVSVIS